MCINDNVVTTEFKAKLMVKEYKKSNGIQSVVSHKLKIVKIIY